MKVFFKFEINFLCTLVIHYNSNTYSTSHCTPAYYYHHNHHHHHHYDQTSLRLTFRLAVSKSLSV